jgi:hypothetical protein
MVLDLETLRTDDDGNDVVIMRFSPHRSARDATVAPTGDGNGS